MLFLIQFAHSESTAIFRKAYPDNRIIVYASGSSSQYINDSLQITKPQYTIDQEEKTYDWCSQCSSSYTDYPWISFSLKDAKFHIDKYMLRAGCCYDGCCCYDYGYCEKCCLYSWEFQISIDNKTWTTVHRIDKDSTFEYCSEKIFELEDKFLAKYIRIIQTAPCPGEMPCMALNKVEVFGDIVADDGLDELDDFVSFHDDDDVSIIGHLAKNGNTKLT